MAKVNEKQVALTLGSFAAAVHIIWIAIVMAGYGQALLSWVQGIHFVSCPMTVGTVGIFSAIELIVIAFIVGSIAGLVISKIWNFWEKKK